MPDLNKAVEAMKEFSDALWSIVCPRCGCLHADGDCCVSETDATTKIAEHFNVDEEMLGGVCPGMTWDKMREMRDAELDEEF